MKAIKLASIFAVTAVAAAVSTTTIAAEPVFSGSAGLNYELTDGAEKYGTEGEVNIIADTGVVYFDIDMNTTDDGTQYLVLDEAYVIQGAVKFGDFDGSISDDAVTGTGVWLETEEYTDGSVTDLGIQYSVTDDLTVALEMKDGYDGTGFALAYAGDFGGLTIEASAGSYDGEKSDGTTSETTNYALGVSTTVGIATLGASYAAGELNEADFSTMILGADFAISEAVSFSAQHNSDLEAEVSNLDVTLYFTAGDVTYFAANTSGDSEATVIGAYAEF